MRHASFLYAIGLAVATVSASFSVFAADGGKTREQVKAEYLEAVRTGDVIVGDSSFRLNELYPDRYPKAASQPGKTRAQVQAELADAIRTGDVVVGDSSLKLNELYPNRYPAPQVQEGKTRAQVRAELAEALRTGDIIVGESSQKANELHPGLYPKALRKGDQVTASGGTAATLAR